MDTERFEELISLSIGELREMLAHEDSEATFESFLVDNGWIDGEYDLEEEDDWDDEDEISAPEEDECDFEDGAEALEDSEAEELAQKIAGDIAWGKYSLEAIEGLYSEEIVDRIKYLI